LAQPKLKVSISQLLSELKTLGKEDGVAMTAFFIECDAAGDRH
jgi:hypothetical protein